MSLRSTNAGRSEATWREAVLRGLAPDGGLYTPEHLPSFDQPALQKFRRVAFTELSSTLAREFLAEEVSAEVLDAICKAAFTFPVPLRTLDEHTHVLELFHGPTCAFKDFGARFMARLFRHFWGEQDRPLTVLAATSGDTGSAVASAFFDTSPHPMIRVAVLYPRGKVSAVQRKQMTTLGHNITAFEVQGTFDDCQALVKRALQDQAITATTALTSANSINIARLLPQMFYYAHATLQCPPEEPPIFSVPSGNLGNLTGGLLAQLCGFPASHFIAACNANRTFPLYLTTGKYVAAPSTETISNAMDVGNPSNFYRILSLYGSEHPRIQRAISGYSINDADTKAVIRSYYDSYGYILDPHTAVGACALERYRAENNTHGRPGIILATAHPAKFSATVRDAIGIDPPMPDQLRESLEKPESFISIENDSNVLAKHLMALGSR